MQTPIIRTVHNGQAWLAMFFLLTGYSNALKPIKLARSGDLGGATDSLMSSAFRKPFRLCLPTAAALSINWLLAQFGYFSVAHRVSGGENWLAWTSPFPSPTWTTAVVDLVKSVVRVWIDGEAFYDKNYWALMYLLKGSFMVYAMLLITLRCTPRYRTLLCTGMIVLSWIGPHCGNTQFRILERFADSIDSNARP